MFEESVSAIAPSSSSSSIWASMNSWFTPSVFFVLLNVMIGTIAFTSSLANNQNKPQLDDEPHHRPNKIARSTSILQRLKSINFYRSQEHHQNPSPQHNSTADSDTLFGVEAQPHYFFNQENLLQTHQSQGSYILEQSLQETENQIVFEQKDSNLDGSEQVHERNAVENELRNMDEIYCMLKGSNFMGNKSASSEQEIAAARMREWEESVRGRGMADEGVDAKADDFINKFKHQLKLQRLDEASGGRR